MTNIRHPHEEKKNLSLSSHLMMKRLQVHQRKQSRLQVLLQDSDHPQFSQSLLLFLTVSETFLPVDLTVHGYRYTCTAFLCIFPPHLVPTAAIFSRVIKNRARSRQTGVSTPFTSDRKETTARKKRVQNTFLFSVINFSH